MAGQTILIVEDEETIRKHFAELLENEYSVICAENAIEAEKLIAKWYQEAGCKIDVALVDINLPGGISGADFGKKILDLDPEIGLIHMSGFPKSMINLPYQAMDCLEKPVTAQALFQAIKRALNQQSGAKYAKWQAFRGIQGASSIKLVGHRAEMNESESVERIVGKCMSDDSLIAFVIYKYPEVEADTINICVASTIGCAGGCRFCLSGKTRPLQRILTRNEILGQVYHGLTSYHASGIFSPGATTKVAVNFTCEGDAMAFNLYNCCEAIKVISQIEVGQSGISTTLTSIGSENSLKIFLGRYITLPQVTHYWSLNSLDQEFRGRIMPWTRGCDPENIRDLYQQIAEKTDRAVTVSWILIRGKTDRDQDVEALRTFLQGRQFQVKVMALVDGSLAGEQTVSEQELDNFISKLEQAGVPCRKRKILGNKIFSGCGNTIVEWAQKK